MKNFIRLAVLVLGAMPAAASCNREAAVQANPNNPEFIETERLDFSVMIDDIRTGFDPDSVYHFTPKIINAEDGTVSYSSGRTVFDRGKGQITHAGPSNVNDEATAAYNREFSFTGQQCSLTVTPYCTITLTASSPVNASSSTDAVDVVRDDTGGFRYHLEYVRDGASTITLWNGEGASANEWRLAVKSAASIPLTGIRVKFENHNYVKDSNNPDGVIDCEWHMNDRFDRYYVYQNEESARALSPDFYFAYAEEAYRNPDFGCSMELIPEPVNATGDFNLIIRRNDFSIDGEQLHWMYPFFWWNEANYPEFRWFARDDFDCEPGAAVHWTEIPVKPCELIGRKIWIWNEGPEELCFSDERTGTWFQMHIRTAGTPAARGRYDYY